MTAVVHTVKDFLAAGGELRMRLRERSVGETHDFPSLVPAGLARTLRAEDIAAVLEMLKQQGAAVRSEIVHAYVKIDGTFCSKVTFECRYCLPLVVRRQRERESGLE